MNIKLSRPGSILLAAVVLTGFSARAGDFSYRSYSGDADSFISPSFNYTALADFNGGGRTVNGVSFSSSGASGTGYSLTGANDSFTGWTNNLTGSVNGLDSDFFYSGSTAGNADLMLTGLTPGVRYVTSWYNVGFSGAGGRVIDITPSDTGSVFRFDENYAGDKNGNILRYAFTATASTITYHFDAVSDGDSFHHYAFSNAVENTSLLATPVITAATGTAPFTPFSPSSTDLLQTHATLTNSSNDFGVEGTATPSALTNGAFTIYGGNQVNNSELMVGHDNSFVEYSLDLGFSPQGYDISSIVSLGGWNDSGRDRQLYRILYSKVGSSAFTEIGGLDFNNAAAGGTPTAVQASFATNLTGVDAIRIEFQPGQENGYDGYGEFDVIGTPTPEPTSAMLGVLGAAAVMGRRRRR